MTELVKVTFDIREDQRDRLDALTKSAGIPRSKLVRRGIDLVLDEHDERAKHEQLGREVMRGRTR